jgi:hypothetical protein
MNLASLFQIAGFHSASLNRAENALNRFRLFDPKGDTRVTDPIILRQNNNTIAALMHSHAARGAVDNKVMVLIIPVIADKAHNVIWVAIAFFFSSRKDDTSGRFGRIFNRKIFGVFYVISIFWIF